MKCSKIKAISLLGFFIVCVFMAGPAFGWPWLTCDPQAGVTHYQVTVGGETSVVPASASTCLWYDLEGFLVGDYDFEVKALRLTGNEWGVSDPSPFFGRCLLLGPASGLSVVNQ